MIFCQWCELQKDAFGGSILGFWNMLSSVERMIAIMQRDGIVRTPVPPSPIDGAESSTNKQLEEEDPAKVTSHTNKQSMGQ